MSNVGNEDKVATKNPVDEEYKEDEDKEDEEEDNDEEEDEEDEDEWLAQQEKIAVQVLFRPRFTSETI